MLNGKPGKTGSYGVVSSGWRFQPGLNALPIGYGPEPAPYVGA